jgi:hypothetical protein
VTADYFDPGYMPFVFLLLPHLAFPLILFCLACLGAKTVHLSLCLSIPKGPPHFPSCFPFFLHDIFHNLLLPSLFWSSSGYYHFNLYSKPVSILSSFIFKKQPYHLILLFVNLSLKMFVFQLLFLLSAQVFLFALIENLTSASLGLVCLYFYKLAVLMLICSGHHIREVFQRYQGCQTQHSPRL